MPLGAKVGARLGCQFTRFDGASLPIGLAEYSSAAPFLLPPSQKKRRPKSPLSTFLGRCSGFAAHEAEAKQAEAEQGEGGGFGDCGCQPQLGVVDGEHAELVSS